MSVTERERILAIPDLRERTYQLLRLVREPSLAEQEAFEKRGFVFLPVAARTLLQVVSENTDHFMGHTVEYSDDQALILGGKDYAPQAMTVAFKPTQLFLPDSIGTPMATKLKMIEGYSKREIETEEFPDAKALMLPASVYVQADMVHFQRTGKVLFGHCFVQALDQMDGAGVGRDYPSDRLSVNGWRPDGYFGRVGAAPALVFLRQ